MPGLCRAIALDIDGTLLNSEGELTQRTADALYDFKQKGGHVIIATGRPRPGASGIVERLHANYRDMVKYVVCGEGASVFQITDAGDWELLQRNWSPSAHVISLMAAMEQQVPGGLMWACEFSGGSRVSTVDYLAVMDEYDPAVGKFIRQSASVDNNLTDSIQKAGNTGWVRCIPRTRGVGASQLIPLAHLALQTASKQVGDSFNMGVEVSPVRTEDGTGSVVFQQAGMNKSMGLEAVCEASGLTVAEFCTFGDGDNDAGMLKWSSRSVCPSNATPSAKLHAKVVSALSNDQDFIAHELGKLFELPRSNI